MTSPLRADSRNNLKGPPIMMQLNEDKINKEGSSTTISKKSINNVTDPSPIKDPIIGKKANTTMTSTAASMNNNAVAGAAMATTKEEDITKDDLQAMKDMIGDIKKDPSLLYRLSSLPGGSNANNNNNASTTANTAAAANGRNNAANHNSSTGKIFVDDDATDVSSLGMMSSSEYNNGSFYEASPRGAHHIKHGSQQSSSAFALAAAQSATAVRRTNHDAEIALRMQSLRAKRGLTQQQQHNQGHSYSPLKNMGAASSSPNTAAVAAGSAVAAAAAAVPSHAGTMGAAVSTNNQSSGTKIIPPSNAAPHPSNISAKLERRGATNGISEQQKSDHPHPLSSSSLAALSSKPPSSSTEQKNRKHIEGRRASNDSNGTESVKSSKSHRSSNRHKSSVRETTTKGGSDGENSDNSVALVLFDEKKAAGGEKEQHNQALTVSSRGGGGGYSNYVVGDPPLVASSPSAASAQHYHSAVSKYVVDERRSSNSNRNTMNSGGQPHNGEYNQRKSTSKVSSSSSHRRSTTKEGTRNRMERQGSETSIISSTSSSRTSDSKRSRSELPRRGKAGGNKDRVRGASEQPKNSIDHNHHHYQRSNSHRGLSQAQNGHHSSRSEHHPPQQPQSSSDDRISSSARSRRSGRHKRGDDPPSSLQQQQQQASSNSIPLNTASLMESLRAEQQQSNMSERANESAAVKYGERSRSVPPPQQTNNMERVKKENKNRMEESQSAAMEYDETRVAVQDERSREQLSTEERNVLTATTHRPKMKHTTKARERGASVDSSREGADKVSPLPISRNSFESSTVNNGVSSTMDNNKHPNGHGPSESSPPTNATSTSQPSPLGHTLAHLDQILDRHNNNHPTPSRGRRRPSVESESGKSVMSRLSRHIKKNKTPSKRSVSSADIGRGSASYYNDSGDSSPMQPLGSDGSDHQNNQKEHSQHHSSFHNSSFHNSSFHNSSFHRSKGLVSRISNTIGGTSPNVASRRRMASADNFSAASSDAIEKMNKTDRSYYDTIANSESDHVTLGIELAIRSGQVPRLCDERGRCLFHPHIRLQKPKLFGGWKILFQHCPDCAVEHMKKTQEKLAMMKARQKEKQQQQLQKEKHQQQKELKKKKKRNKESNKDKEKNRQQDPMIGKNVGDEHFTAENKPTKKKRDRKKEKEKLREELAAALSPSSALEDVPAKGSKPTAAVHQDVDDGNNQQQQPLLYPKENEGNESNHEHAPQPQQQTQTNEQYQTEPPPPPSSDPSQDRSSLALVPHKPSSKQKQKRVNGLPWSDYNGHSGRYTGEVNEQYLPHGTGEMVYDRGVISSGVWYDGVLDTEEDDDGRGGGSGRGGGNARSGRIVSHREEYTPDTLPNYSIGDKGRSEDMIITSKKETAASMAQIRRNDAAWVRRSDGGWTYAIVKDRTYEENDGGTIRFKVNVRGSTKAFPTSQWGTYVRRIRRRVDAPAAGTRGATGGGGGTRRSNLGDFLDNKNAARNNIGSSNSVAGGNVMRRDSGGDLSVSSAHSAPMMNNSSRINLTSGKMNIRARSRSKSRNRKKVTTLPLLFSSSMSVSEENEGHDNDDWETASGSGYRLRGIDP